MRAGQLRQQPLHLGPAEHNRQPRRTRRPLHAVEPRKLAPQHLAVEKQNRGQRLVLRRRSDLAVRGKMIEKRRHFRFAEHLGMALAIEEDEAPDPVHVGLLRAPTVVPNPNRLMHALEQSRAAYLYLRFAARRI